MGEAGDFLEQRRQKTEERVRSVKNRLQPARMFLGEDATVYVTGSFGRGEASEHSDLDVFILSDADDEGRTKLRPLETIQLQSALIDAAEKERLPPFSDDGTYLSPHSLKDMIGKLGGPGR